MNGASEPPPLSAKSFTGKLNRFTYLVAVRNAVRLFTNVTFFPHYNTTYTVSENQLNDEDRFMIIKKLYQQLIENRKILRMINFQSSHKNHVRADDHKIPKALV